MDKFARMTDREDEKPLEAKHDVVQKEKINIAITSILASASLMISKIIIASTTNSLGILSEGMHSGLDVIAATMTLYAVRMARKPPDLDHNYGYAKFESLTSLAEIILLLIIAGWILYEGVLKIFFVNSHTEITVFSFGVMIISIIVDYGRSRALYRVANKYGSQALEADALHFRVDMLTSSIVLVGLSVVFLFGIQNADAFAAILVSILIVYTSLGLGRRTLDVLLDKAPKGIQAQILESVTGLEGVKQAHSIRVRRVGRKVFIDLHIEVPRTFTHDKAHRIATNVEEKIKDDVLSDADVVVHVDSIRDDRAETIKDKIRFIATEFPQIENIHSIYISKISSNTDSYKWDVGNASNNYQNHFLHLYLDIQMDNSLSLKTAHNIIDDFEKRIKLEIPNITNITTHMETESNIESSIGSEKIVDRTFSNRIKEIAISIKGVIDCKDISLVTVGKELHITLTIKIIEEDDNISINQAHNIATDVQNKIMANTDASRVIVHTEPA